MLLRTTMSAAISCDSTMNDRWMDIRRFTDRASSFGSQYFQPGSQNLEAVHKCKVLVVGAGGLGCELLKNLALSGFQHLEVIDMDTIDLSNLNRQFLFRESDIGKSKAEVAARFVERRVEGCSVIPHNKMIQEMDESFYAKFDIIICGLDSIVARRWLNAMLCDLVVMDESGNPVDGVIPLIDGGTEGFKGNARVIVPRISACVECTLDLYPPQVNFPLCTIAHTPRLPEHCIEYVKVLEWDKIKPFQDSQLDADNPDHVQWVLERARLRADSYGIYGVDLRLTQGVLKRIIPAVASTNAVIAASCTIEALKAATNISNLIDNYLQFTDTDGIYVNVINVEKNPECIVCSGNKSRINVDPSAMFGTLFDHLVEKYQLKNPTLSSSKGSLYMISTLIPEMKEVSEKNLEKPTRDILANGEELFVVDESLRRPLSLTVAYVS